MLESSKWSSLCVNHWSWGRSLTWMASAAGAESIPPRGLPRRKWSEPWHKLTNPANNSTIWGERLRSVIILRRKGAELSQPKAKYNNEKTLLTVACEKIRFSSLFVAGDVSQGGTSATQRKKFHTDDANQCLHNKSGSHRVPNINSLSIRRFWGKRGKMEKSPLPYPLRKAWYSG